MSTIFLEGKIYVFLLLLLLCNVLFESSKSFSNSKKILAIVSSIILCLFIGLRWETGTDWNNYKTLFDTLELDWTFLLNIYHFDFGYVLLNAFVRTFSDSYTIFLIINSVITIYYLTKFILKNSPYPNISLFFFYTNFMIAQFMGSNRRMMAMVFILWFFHFVYNTKRKKSITTLGIAFLFHRSALFNLIAYYIPKQIISIRKTIVLLFLTFIIGILQIPAKVIEFLGLFLVQFINHPIIEKIVYYSETNDEHLVTSTGSLIISTILAIVKRSIFLIFYFYIIKTKKIDSYTKFLYNIYIIGFAGYLLFVGSFFQMLTSYLSFIEVILIGRMYSYTNGKTKMVFCVILLLFGILQISNALMIYPDLYMPYIPFWSNNIR